jgi:rod shape-determining protein MreB and related proteins
LNVAEPVGNLIVDIGGGTTEIALISLSGIVGHESIRVAGDEMTDSIVQYFKQNYNILIGDRTAEMIKCQVGSAVPFAEEVDIEVKGRDLVAGIPRMIRVSSTDIRQALNPVITEMVGAIRTLLERMPPELSADIFDRGIMLTGGGALLKGLDERIRLETNLPVHVAEDPLSAVVRGTGKVLENIDEYSAVLIKNRRY